MPNQDIHRPRVAIVASYPAVELLSEEKLRIRHRGGEHPSSWIRAVCMGYSQRGDVTIRVFVDSRPVLRREESFLGKVPVVFCPKPEPARLNPYDGFLPKIFRLRREIAAFRPHVVHGYGIEQGNGLVAVSVRSGVRVVGIQGILARLAPFLIGQHLKTAMLVHLERYALRRADVIVAENEFARRWSLALSPKARHEVIPHAVNPEFLEALASVTDPVVACVGTLSRIKGTDVVLKAFSACRRADDATLVLIGPAPRPNPYEDLARSLGIAGRVRFAGKLSRSGLIDALCRSRMLVLGSRMDTSPNVLTEAQAVGLPVVATRVGGIPEMVDDDIDGFLVDSEDPERMAARMDDLFRDTGRAYAMGRTGREKAARIHGPGVVAEQHAALYRELAEERLRNEAGAHPAADGP